MRVVATGVVLTGVFLVGCGASESRGATTPTTPTQAFEAMKTQAKKGEWAKVYDGFTVRMQRKTDLAVGFVDALLDDVTLSGNLPARQRFVEVAKLVPDVPEAFAAIVVNEKVDGDRAELQIKSAVGRLGTVHMVKETGNWKMSENVQWHSELPDSIEELRALVLLRLQTIRTQIELFNWQNSASAYDANTKLDAFWEPLIQGEYLGREPANPLQGDSTKVGVRPGRGIGWVWAESISGNPRSWIICAVDADGQLFD